MFCYQKYICFVTGDGGGWMVVRVVGGDRSGRHDDQARDVGGKLIGQQEVLLVNHH